MIIIEPSPFLIIFGKQRLHKSWLDLILLCITLSNCSISISSIEPINVLVAALQIRESIPPKVCIVLSTKFLSWSSSAILQAIGNATSLPTSSFISFAVSSQASIFLDDIMTLAPISADWWAIDLPIPLELPVIRIDLFLRLNNDIFCL